MLKPFAMDFSQFRERKTIHSEHLADSDEEFNGGEQGGDEQGEDEQEDAKP